MREAMRNFLKEEQYDLVSEWGNLFGSLTQLATSQLTQRFGTAPLNSHESTRISRVCVDMYKSKIWLLFFNCIV